MKNKPLYLYDKETGWSRLLHMATLFSLIFAEAKRLVEMEWYFHVLAVIGLYIFISLTYFRKVVRIENGKVRKGIYTPFFRFVKMEREIWIKDIDTIDIYRDDQGAFVVRLSGNSGALDVAGFINKKPAERYLQEVQAIVNKASVQSAIIHNPA